MSNLVSNPEGHLPDLCAHCRQHLHLVAMKFHLIGTRALYACSMCGLAYAEPERRASWGAALSRRRSSDWPRAVQATAPSRKI
jgi:hypothetical protein